MSPDRLGTALRDLVDDVEEGMAPPVAGELWAGGRRRRTARLVPALAAACVAALLALVVWPTGAPRASVPAVQPDVTQRLTTYPSAIPMSPLTESTTAPGVTAAFVPGDRAGGGHAVSPQGVVTEVTLPLEDHVAGTEPVLSPDGRWLARGPSVADLMTGAAVSTSQEQVELGRTWVPDHDSWWSPDSRRVFYGAFDQGVPRYGGVVVGTDGSTITVPLVGEGLVPVFAGWLDEQTLLALVDIGSGQTVLQAHTWRLGDVAWVVSEAFVSWPPTDLDGDETSQELRATLSPDGSRLLMTALVTDPGNAQNVHTQAMMFDPVTGAQLGMPQSDGVVDPERWAPGSFVEWEGWGCRPAWHDGLPVVTEGGVTGFVDTDLGGVIDGSVGSELVSVSGRYDEPCVAFAGDELRGTPMVDSAAVWQERGMIWGGVLLLIGLLVVVVRWVRRERRWAGLDSSLRPIVPGRV